MVHTPVNIIHTADRERANLVHIFVFWFNVAEASVPTEKALEDCVDVTNFSHEINLKCNSVISAVFGDTWWQTVTLTPETSEVLSGCGDG